MWVFLTARIRRWVLMGLLLPLAGGVARRVADRLEAGSGPSRVSRGLRTVGSWTGRGRRGRREQSAVAGSRH